MKKSKIGLYVTFFKQVIELNPGLGLEVDRRLEEIVIEKLSKFGEIIYPGLVLSAEQGKRAKERFIREDIDIVIVLEMSYTLSNVSFAGLKDLNIPVIVWNTSLLDRADSDYSWKELVLDDGIVGTVELTSFLKRIDHPHYYIVSGLMEKDTTYNKLAPYIEAARVVKVLSNSNIGFIGNSIYTGMLDLEVDETFVKNKFGINILHLSPVEIAEIFKSVSQKDIDFEEKVLSGKYENIELKKDQFDISVRMGLTYKKLIEKYKISSFANYCQSTIYDPDIKAMPCLGTTMCISSGVPFACEGDIGNAISLLIVKELTGNSTFSEAILIDYDKNTILLGHCGQGNLNFARNSDDVKIGHHTLVDEYGVKGASSNFSYKDGKAVLVNTSTDSGCNWKMAISSGEVFYHNPSDLGWPQAWFDPGIDLDEFMEKWFTAGPSHHGALGYGDVTGTLTKIGDMLDLNVYEIK